MKIIIGEKGKSYSVEIPKEKEISLYGMRIGDTFDGGIIGASGYKLKITGGSDKDGSPMKKDLLSTGKTKMILTQPPGFWPSRRGERRRKTVRGAIVSEWISQLNTVVVESGPTPLAQLFPSTGEKKEKKEEKKKK